MAVEIIDGARRVPPAAKMSFEEFLDWCDEDTWAEWVDGEVVMVSPATVQHEGIGSFLAKVLGIFVEAHDLGVLMRAPFLMRHQQRPSGREPDLFFISRQRLHMLKDTYLDGPADLVIDIVSSESVGATGMKSS